jgi:hypothetical protein
MGSFIEDLWDHEGYGARRLPDGSLTGTWTAATAVFSAHVAACSCGWHGEREHPPTDDGEQAAIEQWETEHATPLLARQMTRRRAELAQVLRALGGIADFVDNPTNLPRIARAVERAGELTDAVQRDLARQAPEREADDER